MCVYVFIEETDISNKYLWNTFKQLDYILQRIKEML